MTGAPLDISTTVDDRYASMLTDTTSLITSENDLPAV